MIVPNIDAVMTALTALMALYATYYQIAQSNKQGLFNHRLSVWSNVKSLMNLCEANRMYLERRQEGPDLANNLSFQFMTNNAHLYSIGPSIAHTLEQDYQQSLQCKLAELQNLALEASFVFKGCLGSSLELFIDSYRILLFSMYQYQILLDRVEKIGEEQHKNLADACALVGEPERREKLVNARRTLLESYNRLIDEKAEKKVERQCRLR